MDKIMKIVNSFEDSGLLIKDVYIEQLQTKKRNKKVDSSLSYKVLQVLFYQEIG